MHTSYSYELLNSLIWGELSGEKSIRVDERDLFHMVWGPTFLSLAAWRQVSETLFHKRPPGRTLGEHRLVRSFCATSRGIALNFLHVW